MLVIKETAFETVICKMAYILLSPQHYCVKGVNLHVFNIFLYFPGELMSYDYIIY